MFIAVGTGEPKQNRNFLNSQRIQKYFINNQTNQIFLTLKLKILGKKKKGRTHRSPTSSPTSGNLLTPIELPPTPHRRYPSQTTPPPPPPPPPPAPAPAAADLFSSPPLEGSPSPHPTRFFRNEILGLSI